MVWVASKNQSDPTRNKKVMAETSANLANFVTVALQMRHVKRFMKIWWLIILYLNDIVFIAKLFLSKKISSKVFHYYPAASGFVGVVVFYKK